MHNRTVRLLDDPIEIEGLPVIFSRYEAPWYREPRNMKVQEK